MAKISFIKNPTAASSAPVIDVPSVVVPVAPSAPVAPEIPVPPGVDETAADLKADELGAPAVSIPTSAIIKIPTQSPGVPAVQSLPAVFDDNDISLRDIYLPRINLVHNVGGLSAIFSPGEVVLNQELVIHTPSQVTKKIVGTPPLNITVIGFKRKQFAEKVAGGEGGMLVNTEAEVVANNGTLSYPEWKQSLTAENPAARKRYFEEYRTALLLIEKPEHVTDDTQFIYECAGKFYAVALWGMKGTAFTHAAKHMLTARKIGVLQRGFAVRSWAFTTEQKLFGANWTWVPSVKLGPPNDPEFIAFAQGILGGSN